jgi:hypothetical protein
MSFLRNIASGLRSLFRKEQLDLELDEELRGYLEMAIAEKMKTGMSRKDAVREARLDLGNLEVTKEIVRAARWWRAWSSALCRCCGRREAGRTMP